MSNKVDHTKILQKRYYGLLKPLKELYFVTEMLYNKNLLTSDEKADITEHSSQANIRKSLCSALTDRGISKLVEISQILKNEQRRQLEVKSDITSSTGCSSSSSSTTSTAIIDEELGGGSETSQTSIGDDSQQVYCLNHRSQGKDVLQGNSIGTENDKDDSSTDSSVYSSPEKTARPDVLVNGKREKSDVPDPPMEVISTAVNHVMSLSSANHVMSQSPYMVSQSPANHVMSPHVMEDAFVILFFTFITQQLQHFLKQREDESSSIFPGSDSCSSSTCKFPWLTLDLPLDNVRDYFPAEAIKTVVPNPNDPIPLKLSVILDAFQQFLDHFENMKAENQILRQKLEIENESTELRSQDEFYPNSQWCSDISESATKKRIADLEEQLEQVEPLQKAYIRSEERCKQLVEVTQQWALECEEKIQLICVFETEVNQLKGEMEELEKRVAKYKKFWIMSKEHSNGRVNDSQFEELRNELAMRRELYDKVLVERDVASKRIRSLKSEIEALRDHNAQLSDRAANFKVQAQAKEPSVREMSNLHEQKRRLEMEAEQLKKDKVELTDKILALELLVSDLTTKNDQQYYPKKTQAMVTGQDPLRSSYGTTGVSSTSPNRSNYQTSHTSHLHYSPFPPTTNSTHHNGRITSTSSHIEEDTNSLTSSEGESSNFSSYGSGKCRNIRIHDSSRNASSQKIISQLKSCDISVESHDSKVQLNDPPIGSRDSVLPTDIGDTDDYTRRIRYPNHSKIQVQPLVDEDIFLSETKGVTTNPLIPPTYTEGTAASRPQNPPKNSGDIHSEKKSPVYFDRSRFDPYRVQVYAPEGRKRRAAHPPARPVAHVSSSGIEKKCPVCQHVFLTLSESEFQEHVAVCFK